MPAGHGLDRQVFVVAEWTKGAKVVIQTILMMPSSAAIATVSPDFLHVRL